MIRALAMFSLITAIAMGFGEVYRNWGDWQWWPFCVVHDIAASLLLAGGISTLRFDGGRAHVVLATAWGFTCAMWQEALVAVLLYSGSAGILLGAGLVFRGLWANPAEAAA